MPSWVEVNGERRSLPSEGTLGVLLTALGIAPDTKGVAVAVNESIVPRSAWAARPLRDGDRIEIVRAVQGG